MQATSAAAITALPDGLYRILIGIDGAEFKWVKDTQVSKSEQLPDLFSKDLIAGIKPAEKTLALTTGYAAALTALEAASPRARAAILVPEPLLPKNQDLLARLSSAAFKQRVSFFPVAPKGGVSAARAQNMIDLAGPTGGRFLPDALDGRPAEERRAMFSEFRGGASQIFTVKKHDQYSLPFESKEPANVIINYTDVTDSLNLKLERKPLKGLELLGAWTNPAYWGNWLFTPGRLLWGLSSLVFWLLALGAAMRLFFRLFVFTYKLRAMRKSRKFADYLLLLAEALTKLFTLAMKVCHANMPLLKQSAVNFRSEIWGRPMGPLLAAKK